jgi:hypothetical protein
MSCSTRKERKLILEIIAICSDLRDSGANPETEEGHNRPAEGLSGAVILSLKLLGLILKQYQPNLEPRKLIF